MPFISASAISPYNKIRGGAVPAPAPAGFSFGNMLKFDGNNDAVTFSEGQVGNDRSTMSISFWINLPTETSGLFLGSRSVSDPNDGWVIAKSTNPAIGFVAQFRSSSTPGTYQTYDQTKFNTYGEPVFITLLYDGSNVFQTRLKMYFNGVYTGYNYIAPSAPTVLSSTAGNNFSIGDNLFSGTRPNECSLTELAIWYDILTDEEIIYLYNEGNGNFASDVKPESLRRYYRFNSSGDDSTLIDEGLDGVNGTLEGFTRPPDYWVAYPG